MNDTLRLGIVRGAEQLEVSLEQRILQVDYQPVTTLTYPQDTLIRFCAGQPGHTFEWGEISDGTKIRSRKIGFGLAQALVLPEQIIGTAGLTLVSAIFSEQPTRNKDGSLSVRELSGLRMNSIITDACTEVIVDKQTGQPKAATEARENLNNLASGNIELSQLVPPREAVVPQRMPSIVDVFGSGYVSLSLQDFLVSFRICFDLDESKSDEQVGKIASKIVDSYNAGGNSYKIIMINGKDGPRFEVRRTSSLNENFPRSSGGSQLGNVI